MEGFDSSISLIRDAADHGVVSAGGCHVRNIAIP